jgi:hypothetical protein
LFCFHAVFLFVHAPFGPWTVRHEANFEQRNNWNFKAQSPKTGALKLQLFQGDVKECVLLNSFKSTPLTVDVNKTIHRKGSDYSFSPVSILAKDEVFLLQTALLPFLPAREYF